MTISEAQHLLQNEFNLTDSLVAPPILDGQGNVSEDFIKFCVEKGYKED